MTTLFTVDLTGSLFSHPHSFGSPFARVPQQTHKLPTATRWSSKVSLVRFFERYVTKFAPRKALKLIARGKLTFENRCLEGKLTSGDRFLDSGVVVTGSPQAGAQDAILPVRIHFIIEMIWWTGLAP